MAFNVGLPEILMFMLLILIALGIGILCWVWMKRSRASQTRVEEKNDRIIRLLEEQNELLRSRTGAERS